MNKGPNRALRRSMKNTDNRKQVQIFIEGDRIIIQLIDAAGVGMASYMTPKQTVQIIKVLVKAVFSAWRYKKPE